MKYKWKDKVRIKSKKELECISEVTDDMLKNCGAIMTIACLVEDADGYIMKEDGDFHFLWSDEMIEGLVEEEIDLIPKFGEFSDNEPLDIPTMTTEFVKEHGFPCPEGFIFKDENGNVINATKIVLEKKKKEYPKTYEECKYILGITTPMIRPDYNGDLIVALQKLLICRNAYWKIAGEEMGLGKPWKPDWEGEGWYVIVNHRGDIVTDVQWHANAILAFPTEEMRDEFFESFKSEIESCKELL